MFFKSFYNTSNMLNAQGLPGKHSLGQKSEIETLVKVLKYVQS